MRDLHNFPRRSYWLRRLENHGRKERVPVGDYTIEHILPQNEHLSAMWREALGPEWQRVQERWLHTLGNLTLTGYNSEYSDRPFKEKRDMQGGFKESPLRLNEGLGALDTWNEATIQMRAKRPRRAGCAGLGTTLAAGRGTGGLPPEGGTPRRGTPSTTILHLAEDSSRAAAVRDVPQGSLGARPLR